MKKGTEIETLLYESFQTQYSYITLEDVGESTYDGSLTSIMYYYWKSFLTIKYLVVETYNHNIHQLFTDYHQWDLHGRIQTLSEYFSCADLI